MSEIIDTTAEIAHWIANQGYQVFLNRQNSLGYPTFHSRGGSGSKTDILVINPLKQELVFSTKEKIDPRDCIAIETKSGDKLGDIFEGTWQLQDYASRWASREVVYYTDQGDVLQIGVFALATRYSPAGYIYMREIERSPWEWDFWTAQQGLLEYPICKSLEAQLSKSRKGALKRVRFRAKNSGHCLQHYPRYGILKAGVGTNGDLTSHPCLFFSNQVVPVMPRSKITPTGMPQMDSTAYPLEAKIERETDKAFYLLLPKLNSRGEWFPKSQIISRPKQGTSGTFWVSRWIAEKKQVVI